MQEKERVQEKERRLDTERPPVGWPPESVGHFASQVRGEMASLDRTKFLE